MAQAEACGFPEFNHFPLLVQYFQFFAQKLGWRYLGEIMRPAGDSLSDEQYQETFAWYYNLVRQAGEQLIRQGRIAPEVQTGLRQDLFPGGPEAFREEANRYWSETMAKFGLTGKPPGQAG
ncbi:MAG: hypothetical protein FJ126_06060 [Deltaproteobacteria bacterium]|nr:hypothetical protein [Deltaproteobacteria bacterium]